MKQILRILTLLTFIFFTAKANAQLTNLSNNTNIRSGVALGSIGVMADKDGLLYKTDGTPAGTVSFANVKVRVDTTVQYVIMNGKIYFTGVDFTGTTGHELWVTDGTENGTQLVKDIYSGTASSQPRGLFVFNNAVYFFAKTASDGVELWKSDGTPGGTVEVKDINPGTTNSYNGNYTSFFANNGILYFDANDGTNGVELWKTDGTGGGTVMIKNINAGANSSNAENFAALGTEVFFSATDATNGTELWKTDGTTGGTVLVQDIESGPGSSSPNQFVAFQNKIFFAATTGSPLTTGGLYSTDGNSVTLVKSFGLLGNTELLSFSVILNNKLVFLGYTVNAITQDVNLQVWASDGTTAGTTAITNLNPGNLSDVFAFILPDIFSTGVNGNYHTHSFNGKIFFAANDGTHGVELWITDGTSAGTSMVKDINPGTNSSLFTSNGEFAASWFYTADNFYFTANDGTHGNELWKTDGTEANTSMIKDLNPDAASSDPFMFMFLNSHIYLTADNGDNANEDRDLYILDESVILPVSLLSFNAVQDKNAVDVKWVTISETNTKDYIVQRSYNGMQFQSIGTVPAAGNSTKQLNYLFKDADALQSGAGKIYYRLQIRDNDGKTSYSKIAVLNILSNGNILALYPNPVKEQLYVVTNTAVNAATVRITNASGKLVLVQQFENIQAGDKNKVNVAALAKGVYYLEFITINGKQSMMFIKY
jgi:ELWxxDGT repeat protein